MSAQYRPFRWIEINTDLAFAKARFRTADLAAYELDGPYVSDAPSFIGSFGILVDDLGPWSGGLQWRRLGPYPLVDGERLPEDKGCSEFNLDVSYTFSLGWKLQASVFNLLNTHANAASYYYVGRLFVEPREGVADRQVHPLEPTAARFTITRTF